MRKAKMHNIATNFESITKIMRKLAKESKREEWLKSKREREEKVNIRS